ncbi:MAG: hypothetical protein Q8P91_02245, partial [bacterium]|nr:hypothetical protein [bacterium]
RLVNMKNLSKNKIFTVLIIIATLILAGIAVFTAIRLYQLRKVSVSPTSPESKPKAAEITSCTALTFNLSTTTTPTPTPTTGAGTPLPSPSGQATPTATPTPTTGPETPLPSPSGQATPTSTSVVAATATPTPVSVAEEPSLPDAGTSLPTVIGIGIGILLLLGSLLLAL